MKIKTTIFLICILLTVVPVCIISATVVVMHTNEMTYMVRNDLESITRSQIELVNTFLYERDANMRIVSEYSEVQELLRESDNGQDTYGSTLREKVETILRSQCDNWDSMLSMTVVDKEYRVAACSQPTEQGILSGLKNTEIVKTLGRDTAFGPIKAGENGARGQGVLGVRSIYDGDELMGYLVEELDLTFFDKIRLSIDLVHQGTIYIMDGKSQIISAGSSGETRTEYVLPSDERSDYSRAWQNRDQTVDVGVIDYRVNGKKYMTCYGNIEEAGWWILASVCIDDILMTRELYTRVVGVVLLVVPTLLLAINILIDRTLARPLDNIVKTFAQIRRNKDFSLRVDVPDRSNELTTISAEINKLLEDIDVTIQGQEESLRFLKSKSERDPMTDLFNRDAIEEIISMKMDNARINKDLLACVLVDIDDFKEFNTRYGHNGGDKVISFVAGVMREMSADTAGRIGGDEFIMCIDNISSEEEMDIWMDMLLRRLRSGLDLNDDGQYVPISCCAGVSLFDSRAEPDYSALVNMADSAMYSVKNANKDGYAIYNRQ